MNSPPITSNLTFILDELLATKLKQRTVQNEITSGPTWPSGSTMYLHYVPIYGVLKAKN